MRDTKSKTVMPTVSNSQLAKNYAFKNKEFEEMSGILRRKSSAD